LITDSTPSLLKDPAGHNLQLPSGIAWSWYWPFPQTKQLLLPRVLYLPFSVQFLHTVDSVAAPSWYVPGAHVVQAVQDLLNTVPAPQDLQEAAEALFSFWYCPETQSGQAVDVDSNFLPARQNEH